MIPSNSGGSSSTGCDPVSSNCVVWQGPDIPCISLCAGDTISNVLAKMAELLCQLQPPPGADCCDVSLLDAQCLGDYYKRIHGQNIPDTFVLADYINLLIEYVCQLEGGSVSMPIMPVPNCVDRLELNGSPVNVEDGMELVLPAGSTYTIGLTTGTLAAQFFNGTYDGWADMVATVQCNMLACCAGNMSPVGGATSEGLKSILNTNEGQNAIIKVVDNRFQRLSSKMKYLPPKVVPTGVTNMVGKPVAMNVLLSALEKEFVRLRGMTGTAVNIRDAIKRQPQLNNESRLVGKGTIGNIPGWYSSPADLSQSHSNQWSVISELMDAVKDIQKNHLGNTSCDDIVFDANCTLNTNGTVPQGIKVDFSGTTVKAPFTDCNNLGAKITVVDASLTTIIKHANVAQLQNTSGGYNISFMDSKIDRTSNYQVTVDFCFSDGTFTCAKTITYTVENEIACPTIQFDKITGSSFEYKLTGLNPALGYDVVVICETSTGAEIGRVNHTSPSGGVTGNFGGLVGGQSYFVYTQIKSSAGNITTCDKSTVTTLIPSCSTISLLSSEFGNKSGDIIGGVRLKLSCYNDGSNTYTTVAGFNGDGEFTVSVVTDDGNSTCDVGKSITTYGTFCHKDPSLGITCSSKLYPSGFTQSATGSGWQYVDTVNGANNVAHHVYALVNKVSNSIDQVIACCDCKALYIDSKYTMNYCKPGGTIDVKINVAGYTNPSDSMSWSLASTPNHGSVHYNSSKSETYEGCFTYVASNSSWISDSFKVRLENSCGTSNEITIPIGRSREITKTDGDISVFVDTCTMTLASAENIKTSFEQLKDSIKVVCPTWTGTINYIPVDSRGNSGNYIDHLKSMIDMKSGASGSINVAGGGWTSWKSLPAHWDAAYKGSVPTSTYIFSFVSSTTAGCGNYGEASLGAGFGAQPTATYQTNYDELLDIVNGTTTTSWGASMNSTQPGWGFPVFGTPTNKTKYLAHILIPIISSTNDASAGAALQMAGAVSGKLLNTAEFNGLKMGNIKYPLNTVNYLEEGKAMNPVPYNVTTPRGNAMAGLKDYGYSVGLWLENGVDLTSSNTDLETVLLSILGLTKDFIGYNCSTTASAGVKMKDASDRSLFSFGASCGAASTAAQSSSHPMCIYNNTGTIFDGTTGNKKAYYTQQGAAEAIAADEIDSGWYAVINGANGYQIGEYLKGSGWTGTISCADGLGGCKTC